MTCIFNMEENIVEKEENASYHNYFLSLYNSYKSNLHVKEVSSYHSISKTPIN